MAKKRDIPPVPVSGSADTSAVRSSGRETLANKQVAPTPANTKKSTGVENQTAPVATFVKKRPENSEKQMGPSPLRRSERDKNLDDGPATNVQSTEDGNTETQDPPEVSSRKRKRFNAIRFKARFKPQRVRVESDDEEDSEGEGGASTSEVKTISNADGDKEVEDRDKGVGKCSDVADGQSVHGSPDRAQKAVLEVGLIASDQEKHIGCSSQTKPVEGESVESGNVEKQIGGNCSPSNGHIADTSLSRINHVLENQQELDFRDKDTGTSKPAGVMENAENNNANTNIQNAGSIVNSSKFVEYWVPVQLSNVQLEQYCASLLSNATVFQSCSRSATDDALLEILNSNRKCCNHPYLVDANLQGKITKGLLEPTRILDVDIKVSGKLQFLDLVLPEVKKRQLRALILYQPTSGSASVGPVLGEFVHQRFGQDSYECLDGVGIVSSKKQTALSNFNNEKNRFIFLLASNACNSTVKLSSIDIVIIFDSDLNPITDIKSLQKITIDSQSEQTMVVRLYTSLTLEEKILKLADHDNMIQNLRSKYNALLMWGASDLFNRLEEFHNQSDNNISSEESILNNVVKEFLHIIAHKSESDDTTKSFITRVESCGSYGKNIMFQSEMKTLLPNGDHRVFWKKLLEGKNPVWRFRSESTPRQRKRPNFFSDSCGVNTRRKTVKNVVEGETGRSNEGVPVQNESRLSSGDHFWSTAVGNEENVHDLLKPTVSELCKILKFSENVTTIVESFLKFVIENFQVFKKHTSVLQALMISVCWIGSSLSKYMIDMIDREQSFALAKKHLNFICSKEEADQVYEKLQSVKETFLQNTKDLEIVNNIEECTMPHQEPRMSKSVPLNPQESKPENRDSSNEETLQSTKQTLKEDLARKDENEIDKFNRVWDEKRKQIENERELGKALFRCLYPSKSSKRSEMLKSEEEKFTNKLKEHERLRVIHLSDLKAKLNAPVGQVVVNDERSLHGPAHETQIVDLVRSEKSDQGSPEVAPVLSGNPSEAQIHDKPLNEMCPVVVPAEVIIISDDSSDAESIGSHSSEKQTADAMVKTEPIMENDVTVDNATLLSEPIGDIAAIEEIVSSIPIEVNASELHDEVENDAVGADAMVISEPIGEISAKQNADMENDKAGQAECVEMEVLEVDTNKENPKACIVEGFNETGHDDLVSHVDSVETLAVNNMSENVESADGSHAAEDTVRTSHDAVTPNAESADMGIPTASGMSNSTDLEPNLESTDGSHAVEDPVGTSPDGVAPHAESIEMGITAEKGMPTGNCTEPNLEPVDGSHAAGDPNVSGPADVAPHIESTELGIPAVECNKENADDGTVRAGASQGVEGHNLTSGSSSSSSSSSSADVAPAVSDHSVPPIHDIQSECLQVQQPPDSGIQDQEVQTMSTPVVQIEDNNLQRIDMVQVDQTIIDNSSLDPHNEPVVAAETPITEYQSAALPTSEVLAQTTSEPIVSAETRIAASTQIQNSSHLEPDDVAPHEESAELGIPVVEHNIRNAGDGTMSAGTSAHVVSDDSVPVIQDIQNGSLQVAPHEESAELGIPVVESNIQNAGDGTMSAGTSAHVVSDDSVPVIQDIENGSLQVQQFSDSGIQNQEVLAESTPMVEIEDNSLQFIDMGQGDPIIPDDSSPNSSQMADITITDPMVTEDQPATLPTSEGLAQTSSEPIVAAETPITEPIVVAETRITPHNLMQNASQLERMFALQRNGNFNHMGLRRNPNDPLHLELQRLHSEKENMVKFHQENMQKINVDCEREIAEVTAQIRLKYGKKRQEAETAFNSQKNEVERNVHKVAWNKALAAAFRSKCQDLIPGNAGLQQDLVAWYKALAVAFRSKCQDLIPGNAGLQQASQAGLMQQLHTFPCSSSARRSPGQSSGTQQAPTPPPSISTAAPPPPPSISTAAAPPPQLPATLMPPPSLQRTQPPLQIVDNPSALFSNPLTRYTHNTSLRPTTTTPIRPQPNANYIPNIPSSTTTSRVLTTATTTPIRPPPYANPIPSIPSTTTTSGVLTTATTTPISPPPNANPTPAIPSSTTSTTPSTAIARPPPNIFPIAPSTTTPTTTSSSRPPPAVIPITPSTTPASRLSTSVTSITLSPTTTSTPTTRVTPVTSSTTTTSIAPPTVTPITTSTTSSTMRLPHASNHLSPSTTPIRPPFRLSSFDMSAANLRINTETRGQSQHSRPLVNGVSRGVAPHMRPMVSREVRAPGPHLRPLARSDFRSPAPHMRSFASTGVRSPAPHMRPFRPTSEPSDIGTTRRTLPGQHVTSNIPSTSTSQPPVLVSSVQPLAPLPTEPFSVPPPPPPPPPARSESPQPQPPPPQSQLRHTSHQHPLSSLSDDLNVLMDNVARLHNTMNTPEFSAGGNAAQTSATEVVCLSDDD